jgi:hypothetical protein
MPTTDARRGIDYDGLLAFMRKVRLPQFDPAASTAFLEAASEHLDRMRQNALSQRSTTAPSFNVFRIIGREHYEVTTHSALIASLLDPLGAHEQGDLFLTAFLNLILKRRPAWQFPPVDEKWRISTEKHRIDILLEYPRRPFFIIVENKWFSKDRELQTFKYWEYLKKRYPGELSILPVIYLTRVGGEPNFSSEPANPAFRGSLLPISYRDDLLDAFEECLTRVGAARVRETLSQYLQLLRDIHEDR